MTLKKNLSCLVCTVLFLVLFMCPAAAFAMELETSIDLNYIYEQDRLGEDVNDETTFSQKYLLDYEAEATSILDLLAKIRVDYEESTASDSADETKFAPSLEIGLAGEKLTLTFTYDASIDEASEFEDSASSKSYDNSALLTLEVIPDYMPEVRINIGRDRNFERQQAEDVERTFELLLKKDTEDFQFEFDFDYSNNRKELPAPSESKEWGWMATLTYQKVLWWDVETELSYEVDEEYSEDFEKGVFSDEEERYVHNIQARLQKSLELTPKLSAILNYEYEFNQDLLLIDEDYTLDQDLGLAMEYELYDWLEAEAEFKRESEELVNIAPLDKEEALDDTITLVLTATPTKWLEISGSADWEFNKSIEADTGGSIEDTQSAVYEVDLKQSWGDWWDLKVSASSEYEWENDWLTREEGALKANLKLTFWQNLVLETTYEIERADEFAAFEPLSLDQSKEEDFEVGFSYEKDFSQLISFKVSHDYTFNREEELDEILNFEETVTITEDTEISLTLADFIRGMTLDGSIVRNASDTRDDEEPMLVDILYELSWKWEIKELTLGAEYAYEDSGESFDESSLKTDVAWSNDNFDVSGEYQIDKTFSDEIDENRKANLTMKVKF